MPGDFDMYEAIATSFNDAHPGGQSVTTEDVREELHKLLESYGRFKFIQDVPQDTSQTYRCSFCGKGPSQVSGFIGGPGGVYICNECVDACQFIFNRNQRKRP